jgi:hypothetical protein
MAAAISLWKSGEGSVSSSRDVPAWTNASTYACLGLISMSMGLQGIMGKRLSTQFATTSTSHPPFFLLRQVANEDNHLKVVLTTVWCELMADPRLFSGRRVASRDLKVIAVSALFVGGFCSRAILQAIGSPASLGIGTGIRVLIALSWFFVPGKRAAAPKKS